PLLLPVINKFVPSHITVLSQGELVAQSLADYLQRHPEVDSQCTRGGFKKFYTTDDAQDFEEKAKTFFGQSITAEHITLSYPNSHYFTRKFQIIPNYSASCGF